MVVTPLTQSGTLLKRFAIGFGILAVAAVTLLYFRYRAEAPVCRVGYNEFPPYVMAGANGKPEGLATEMITRAAARAGVKLRWVVITGSADDAIDRNDIDLYPILTVTDDRKARLYLSQPWWEDELALISSVRNPIESAGATAGKRIATRIGVVQALAKNLFPKATLVADPNIDDLEGALCSGKLDGYFLDLRVVQADLLKHVPACSGQPFYITSVPKGSRSLATASSKSAARTAERIYREIAHLSLDGTLSEIAARWGMANGHQTRHMKEVVDAEQRANLWRWGLLAVTLVLMITGLQTYRLKKAGLVAESARREAEESQQRFDAFMNHTPAVTFMKDEDGRIVFVNDAFCKQFQRSLDEIKGKLDTDIWPEEFANELRRNDLRVLASNQSAEITETVCDPSGEIRHFLSLKFPFSNRSGRKFLGGVCLDITERRRSDAALRFSQFSIDHSPDTILWVDSNARIFYANNVACRQLGYRREELLDLTVRDVEPNFTWESFVDRRRELKEKGSLTLESCHRTRSGEMVPVEVSLNYLEFDGQEFSCWMSRDITARKRAEGELSHQAQHDLLTDLANRRYFESRLEQSIADAAREGAILGVFYLDLDGFKLINDTLGHTVGDALLKQVAGRLKTCVRQGDTLARVGGDEFTLIAADLGGEEGARAIAEKLLLNLQQPFDIDGHEIRITGSAGISLFPQDSPDSGGLLRCSDSAMYESKRRGKNQVQFFTPGMGEAARERIELERHLQKALDRGEFQLHYQPQFSLASEKVVRYEALLRWTNPVLGIVPPSKFIPIAEDTSLIIPIGTWVLKEACRQARAWQKNGPVIAGVGVNVSMVQFVRPDFVDTVIAILEDTGLSPYLLELELTETVVMQGFEVVVEKITRLRSMGVSISIDDFGTGYSSLSYLQRLRIDSLKIDRSFVREIAVDPSAASLTRALISLAHSLGIRVVIEGVETSQQLDSVREMGCDMAQGFLLGRPAPALSALVAACAPRLPSFPVELTYPEDALLTVAV